MFYIDFVQIARWILKLYITPEQKFYGVIDRTNWYWGKQKIKEQSISNNFGALTMIKEVYALQDLAAPDGVCFGCGSKNSQGLQIKSYWDSDNVHIIMEHMPDARYVGWPSLVYGGLISCLIDCHSNWTTMAYHYRTEGREAGTLPRIDCVTGSLHVKYIKPTPMGVPLILKARVEGEVGRKTRVLCEVYADDLLTALGDSIFVRVDVGHLAKTAAIK